MRRDRPGVHDGGVGDPTWWDRRLRRRSPPRRRADRHHLLPQRRAARRRRPGAHLHPRAPRRCPAWPHRSWPGLRLRDRPRGDRRGVRRNGRAAGGEVTRPRRDGLTMTQEDAMNTWTKNELDTIARADELEIATRRRDGTLRDPVTVWMVRVGD